MLPARLGPIAVLIANFWVRLVDLQAVCEEFLVKRW